jgi:raffinose/stachyose/melibiose transport system substrate-binding protein
MAPTGTSLGRPDELPVHRHRQRTFRSPLARRAALGLSCSLILSLSCAVPSSASTKTTLNIIEWANAPAVAATQQISAAFETANPGVNVVVSSASSTTDAYSTLVSSSLAAKDVDLLAEFSTVPILAPPAATHIAPSGALALQLAGQLVDLTNAPFMKYFDVAFQKFSNGINGKIYGLTVSEYAQSSNLLVKGNILKKYNLPIPTTYNQLIQECATLKSHGITAFFVSNQGPQSFLWDGIYNQLVMAGHPASASGPVLLKLDQEFYQGKTNWNSAISVQATKEFEAAMEYVEPASTGITQGASATDWAGVPNNYPFLVLGTWAVPTVEAANPKLQLEDFVFPASNNPADNGPIIQPDLAWMIPKSSSHIALAEKWLSFLSEPANYQKWLKATNGFSTEPRLFNNSPTLSWDNAHIRQAIFEPNPWDTWVPPGAPLLATGPMWYFGTVLQSIAPLGYLSVTAGLDASAKAYTALLKSIK